MFSVKGKLFILFVMVGIPTITWAILAWAVMIVLGALHALCSAIPALSFWGSLIATIMVFTVIIFGASMATTNVSPAHRHGGR